ncbi:MAG: hypothetical protein MUC88_17450 [Planctomycetes bacterium]|jgi:hypothetical protein|nr:hypothetical protein [Planctomycetota bacterium]
MTAEGKADAGPCVIVVGEPKGEFVRAAMQLTQEWELDTVPCADVYTALVAIAGRAGRPIMVLGAMKEFLRGNRAFFAIASSHAVRCCCLLDLGSRPTQPQALLAALRTGATLAGDWREAGDILRDWLATRGSDDRSRERAAAPAGPRGHEVPGLLPEDLRATKAELDALLQ